MSLEDLRAELTRVTAEATTLAQNADAEATGAIVSVGPQDAVAVKARMAGTRAALQKKRVEVDKIAKAMKVEVEKMQADLRRQMDEAALMMAPLVEQVEKLQEGIWTVNLYLGTEEEIVTLQEGPTAPEGTPIVVRQQVLYMDEECAVAAEHGGIDVRSMGAFDEWLTSDPAHVVQVLPEVRGVVAIKIRKPGTRDYGDIWTQNAMDEANATTYFLIRNGSMLYRMTTAFDVGERLVPKSDEFTALFVGREYDFTTHEDVQVPLEPGSRKWLEAEKKAGKRERHFMRVALILQGLIDRTPVFHPLPAPTVSLLSMDAYNEGHVVLLADDERAITDGGEPFFEWLRRLNSTLRPGMRIVGEFDSSAFRNRDDEYDHPRITPKGACRPQSLVLHTLTSTTDLGGFRFAYERVGDVVWEKVWVPSPNRPGWGHDEHVSRPVKTRASCTIFPFDRFIIPFDLVTVAEMERYLQHRTERHAYATSFPLLKAAIAAKKAEAEAEAPFRALLTSSLVAELDLDEADAAALVDEFVQWWKTGNRWHRPLNGDPETEAKALRMILTEAKKRAQADRSGDEDAAVATIRARHARTVAVARKPDGTWVAYSRPQRSHTNQPDNVFVHAHQGRRPGHLKTTEWALPSPAFGRWRLVWQDPAWKGWNRTPALTANLTDPEIDQAIDLIREHLSSTDPEGKLLAVEFREKSDYSGPYFEAYTYRPTTHVPLARPFSDTPDDVMLQTQKARVSRERGEVRLKFDGYTGTERVSTWYRDKILDDYTTERLVWRDSKVEFAVMAAKAARVVDRERGEALREQAARLNSNIEAQARAEWEAEERVKFDADFGDPDLWEGHLSTLRPPDLRNGHRRSEAYGAIGVLLEHGVDPIGLTVDRVVETCEKLTGKPYKISLPRPVGHLVVGLEPRPEPEPEPTPESEPEPEPSVVILDADDNVIEGITL